MKIKFNLKLMLTGLMALFVGLSLQAKPPKASALEHFVDAEGETHYGWSLVTNEINEATWEFDDDGMISYAYAAEGDTANQRVFNYAIRNLLVPQDAEYTLQATFVPDAESDLSVERTYGLVAWYQDSDNYLIYWLQQKIGGDWSGQFYGRVDGAFRKMWVPSSIAGTVIPFEDYWRKGEYYDMWWDTKFAHSDIRNQRNMLLTTPLKMKIVSSLDECTVASVTKEVRKFELSQIINDKEELLCVFYIDLVDRTSNHFYTGLYSESFSVGIEDFSLLVTDSPFASDVEQLIDAIATPITNEDQITQIINARVAYESLLDLKSGVASSKVTALETLETAVAAYIDALILALNKNDANFANNVNSVVNLFSSLPEYLQDLVTETDTLIRAINDAQDTGNSSSEPPTSSSETSSTPPPSSSEPATSEPTSRGGCGGSIIASGSLFGFSLLLVGGLALRGYKRKESDSL